MNFIRTQLVLIGLISGSCLAQDINLKADPSDEIRITSISSVFAEHTIDSNPAKTIIQRINYLLDDDRLSAKVRGNSDIDIKVRVERALDRINLKSDTLNIAYKTSFQFDCMTVDNFNYTATKSLLVKGNQGRYTVSSITAEDLNEIWDNIANATAYSFTRDLTIAEALSNCGVHIKSLPMEDALYQLSKMDLDD